MLTELNQEKKHITIDSTDITVVIMLYEQFYANICNDFSKFDKFIVTYNLSKLYAGTHKNIRKALSVSNKALKFVRTILYKENSRTKWFYW